MDSLRARLQWLMGLRVIVVTLLLGFSLGLQTSGGQPVRMSYGLIGCSYLITVPYLWILPRLRNERWIAGLSYSQIAIDLLLETVLIAKTGGVESPFVVLYVITVSLASLVPGQRVAQVTGTSAVLLFATLVFSQLGEVGAASDWTAPTKMATHEALWTFGVNGLAVLLVGLLSGALAEQLRRADETLHEKEQGFARLQVFHESVVQSISSGVFTTDGQGCLTAFNRAACEITGYEWGDIHQRSWREVFNWRPGDHEADGATFAGPMRFEVECKRSNGSRLVLGMTVSPLHERGVQTGLVGVFKDLTEIRDLEEEMRRKEWLAKLGEMSAGMAHEIRNPLGALAGAMQMLSREQTHDEANRHLMDIAVREARRLDDIITAFLQYAKPPALNLAEQDINAILTDTLELIRHEADKRPNLSIETRLLPGPAMAQVDHNQMKQVFWNLAVNAFDAMPGGGRLRITTERRRIDAGERRGEVVEIAFRDTGAGIAKEHLDKIFLPFYTTKRHGSGLGLAAVHRIVDQHGGWIRVESQAGQGSQFVVCLPRTAGAGPRLWHEGREPWKKS